jgi:hypothetical protein
MKALTVGIHKTLEELSKSKTQFHPTTSTSSPLLRSLIPTQLSHSNLLILNHFSCLSTRLTPHSKYFLRLLSPLTQALDHFHGMLLNSPAIFFCLSSEAILKIPSLVIQLLRLSKFSTSVGRTHPPQAFPHQAPSNEFIQLTSTWSRLGLKMRTESKYLQDGFDSFVVLHPASLTS